MRLHHKLRFERGVELYRYRNYDEHTGCAERSAYRRRTRNNEVQYDRRYKREYREEYRSEKRKPVVDFFEVIRRRLTGSDTGDKSAVLLYRLGNVVGVELYLRVEEREEYYKQAQRYRVERISRTCAEPGAPPTRTRSPAAKSEYQFGEGEYREREYKGHNAVRVYFYGDYGGLTAVHLSALNLFCVLYAYLSFGKFYPYDRAEYDYDYKDITYETKQTYSVKRFAEEYRVEFVYGERRSRRYDTRKDQKRYTVGNAVIGNSFAYPHGNASTRGIEQNNYYVRKEFNETGYVSRAARQNCRKRREFAVIHRFLTVTHQNTDRLYDCKEQGQISRIVGNFLSAFFALL